MAFQTPLTVKEVVESINRRKYLLPAIQREVVWDVDQITMLYDSLMKDYPIGSFLFWQVDKAKAQDYQFYEFVREYHEGKSPHNVKANVSGQEDIIGILDGQQRLTALYLGLKGTYAYKEPRKRWDNPQAFPTRKLYINLLKSAKNSRETDSFYDFAFLSDAEVQNGPDVFWFKVGDILNLQEQHEVNDYLLENELMNRPPDQAKFANKTLFKLWKVVHDTGIINYYLEKSDSLDKVLNIFIRVNRGGTILSYSDLLLSIATAQWKNRDAREAIISFVDELNAIRGGFKFDKDLVLKGSIVLADIKDIAFKVDNFNKSNMETIEDEWNSITAALRSAVRLVSSFGYNRDTLTASYSIIPIAYYIKQIGCPPGIEKDVKFELDRKNIRRWLTLSLIKRVFGGHPDNVLRAIREILGTTPKQFPLNDIIERFKGDPKSISITDDDIENMLCGRYGQGYTFSTLALLYPSLDFRNNFQIDHVHPQSRFTKSNLSKNRTSQEDIEFCLHSFNQLPNLQLLEDFDNQGKSDIPFDEWISHNFGDMQKKQDFMTKHFIPDVDFSISNFRAFFESRRDLMRDQLKKALGV